MRKHNGSKINNSKGRAAKQNYTSNSNDKLGSSNSKDNMVQWKSRGGNDPSWYTPTSQILKDVASLPYGYPTGGRQNLGQYTPELNKYGSPGIMTLHFTPTFGEITDSGSAINVSAHALYQYVRHMNSGHSNYDATDLMLYVLAVEQAYMWLHYCHRIYKCAYTHSYVNRYYPEALTRAAGGNYADLVSNLAQLRAYLNMATARLNTYAVPKVFDIFDRHIQLVSEIYADANDAKAQLYLFRPSCLYKFDHDVDGAGMLKIYGLESVNQVQSVGWVNYQSTAGFTFAEIKQITEAVLNPIFSEEDFNIMTGDILKAYGTNDLWQMPMLGEDDGVVIGVDLEVLSQIQNASLMGIRQGGDICQASHNLNPYLSQTIKWKTPYFTGKYQAPNAFLADRYLNVDLKDVTPQDTMVASRLSNIGEAYDATTGTFEVHTRGSEVVDYAVIWRWNYSSGAAVLDNSWCYFTALCQIYATNPTYTYAQICNGLAQSMKIHNMINQLTNFEYHPAVYCTFVFTEANTANPTNEAYSTFDSVAFDLGKFTIIGIRELSDMSFASVQKMLGVRGLG